MKRYTIKYFLIDDKKMWGVYDNQNQEWEIKPKHINGQYNVARTRAKELNKLIKI